MYYYDGSGIAQVLDAARARASRPIRYAVIGLGTGSLACRAEPDEIVHYYEIDPRHHPHRARSELSSASSPSAGRTCRSCSATRG